MSRTPRVSVTIDRLVLRGFAPEQRDAIVVSLSAELQRQFSDQAAIGQLGESRNLAALRTRPMALTSPAAPRSVGTQAARQLARRTRS